MRRVLVSLALSMPLAATALAGTEAWFLDGADAVDIPGPVELELYRGEATGALPAVLVTGKAPAAEEDEEASEPDQVLAVLDLGSSWTRVDEATAKALGAKVKKYKVRGRSTKRAVIPELHLGDVVLRDVRAEVTGEGLVLGLATLDELGAAILPSAGKVKLVPAADAAGLVSGVGEARDYAVVEGKWFEMGRKLYGNGLSLAVEGSVFGHDGLVRLATAEPGSSYSAAGAPDTEQRRRADLYAFGAPVVAGVELGSAWMLRDESLVDPEGRTVAEVGYDLLYGVDLAIDPASGTVALAATDEVAWTDPAPVIVAEARADYEEAIEEAESDDDEEDGDEADGEAAEGEAADGPDKGEPEVVSRETALASALWEGGHLDEALEHYRAAADAAGDHCKPYLELGRHLLLMSEPAEAAPQLRRAGELWDRWYGQDLEVREKIEKGKDVEADFTLAQDTACHEAWGDLALAHLALEEHDEVAGLYDDKVDLDPTLPRAYGLSLVLLDQRELANGPLRRAMNLRVHAAHDDYVALAAAHVGDDETVVFDRQVEAVYGSDEADFLDYLALAEAARRHGGAERAEAVMGILLEKDPYSPGLYLVQALVQRAEGQLFASRESLAEADALLELAEQRSAGCERARAHRAIYLALMGKLGEAEELLGAIDEDGSVPADYHVARAVVLELQGDLEGGRAALDTLADERPENVTATLGLVPELSGPRIKLTGDAIQILEKVHFVTGKAEIRPESSALLEEVADALLSHPEIEHVQVRGHTDSTGDRDTNMALSQARAEAVMGFLVDLGVDAGRLEAVGLGSTEPIADNDTEEGRARNRRVEFVIVEE